MSRGGQRLKRLFHSFEKQDIKVCYAGFSLLSCDQIILVSFILQEKMLTSYFLGPLKWFATNPRSTTCHMSNIELLEAVQADNLFVHSLYAHVSVLRRFVPLLA